MRLAIAKIFAGCIMSALYRSAQIWCGLAGGSDFASDVLVNRFDSNVAGAAFQKTNKLAGSYKLVAVRITAIEHLPSAFRPDNEPIGAWGSRSAISFHVRTSRSVGEWPRLSAKAQTWSKR